MAVLVGAGAMVFVVGRLIDLLVALRPAFGAWWLPLTLAGCAAAVGAAWTSVSGARRHPELRWPRWLMVADAIATTVGMLYFAQIAVRHGLRPPPGGQPVHSLLLLGALAFTTTGTAAVAVLVSALPYLVRRRRGRRPPPLASKPPGRYENGVRVRLREEGIAGPGRWRAGWFRAEPGSLTWEALTGVTDFVDLAGAVPLPAVPAGARRRRPADRVRVSCLAGTYELDINPKIFQLCLRIAALPSDGAGAVGPAPVGPASPSPAP